MEKKKKFFSILVPLATLLITITLVMQNTSLLSGAKRARRTRTINMTYSLIQGSNHVAIPLSTGLKASAVCEQLPTATAIYRWDKQGAQRTYDCDPKVPHNKVDYLLMPHVGYVIEMSEAIDWPVSGTRARLSYNITPYTNFYGFPQTRNRKMYAQDVCKKFKSTRGGLTVTEVYKTTSTNWSTTHDCAKPAVNNFEIEYGVGYMFWAIPKEK